MGILDMFGGVGLRALQKGYAKEPMEGQRVVPTYHPNERNADGSSSNVLLMGVGGEDKSGKLREYVIPTMVNGVRLDPDQAIAVASKQGWDKYPAFDTWQEADSFAKKFHGSIGEGGQYKPERVPTNRLAEMLMRAMAMR